MSEQNEKTIEVPVPEELYVKLENLAKNKKLSIQDLISTFFFKTKNTVFQEV